MTKFQSQLQFQSTANKLALAFFLVMFAFITLLYQPLFILLRDQLITFQMAAGNLATGQPALDDLILHPAHDDFITALGMTWQILSLSADCQIWLASEGTSEMIYRQLDSVWLKKSLWARALILYLSSIFGAAIAAIVMRQRYLSRVSGPLAAINGYIAALADDPRQLLAPLTLQDAPDELRQTASHLQQLAIDIRHALRQKDRLADIGTAVSKINHDLRNILTTATLVSDALDRSDDPLVRNAGPIVSRAIEDASLLCQNMLEYLDAPPEPQAIPVSIAQLCGDLQAGKPLTIDWQGADTLVIDPILFKRMLMNLSHNAQRAGASRLMLDIWRAGHLAVIDVSDNGPGIDKALQPHLFSAFFKGNRGGSGLGLAIAKDLAIALGGDIKLSRSNGGGSEFRIQLPAKILKDATGKKAA